MARDRAKVLANKKRYYQKHRADILRKARNTYYDSPDGGGAKRRGLWTLYRTTPQEVDRMIKEQDGVCLFCLSPLTNFNEAPGKQGKRNHLPAIDHNHACCSGKRSCGNCIRGVLHVLCNKNLGFLEKYAEQGLVTLAPRLTVYAARGAPC